MIKLAISGFCGKMGQRIFMLSKLDKNLKVVVGLENKSHPDIGKIIDGVKVTDNLEALRECDCLIDFSAPCAAIEYLSYLVRFKKSAVIGTTGFSEAEQAKIKSAAKKIPIVFSPNMSIGVNLLFRLAQMAAKTLPGYKVYVEEAHHIHKKDSPSGTAKKIMQVINEEGFNLKTEDVKAIREGEIVGNHKIVFESEVDKLELFHSAKTRDIFVKGALLAASWIKGKKNRLYTMDDILFSNSKKR
ncbi:MAG: 4-hydroxy-tetrahydrodipicolinate reductase [Candidatus Omnitrophota bacterium]|jgi:4-hydroxy-tetrahydrodipicolinate reductase